MDWNPGPGTALLAEFFLKTTLLLVPALLAVAASKRRPAAFRHFILSFALIGLLLVPILSFLPVGWRTSLLPSRPVLAAGSENSPFVQPGSGAPVMFMGFGPWAGEGGRATGSVSGPIQSRRETRDIPPGVSPRSGESPALIRQDKAISGAAEKKTAVSGNALADGAVVFLWLSGLALLVLRLAVGLAGAIRLTREGRGLGDPRWGILVARFLSMVPLRRRIRLRSHADVVVPLTWGWRKPVILVPAGADAWDETERSSALFHELSHVKRADFLFLLLIRVSLAVFWWNPVCWLVYFRIRKEQEIACDELVLRAGIKPSTYAAGLLAFRRSAGFRWNASAALLGLLGKSSFKERLAAILKQNIMIKEVKMKSRLMLAASVILAVAFIGTARPADAEKAAPSPVSAIAETASPSPAALSAQETKTEKEAVQEKEKEKEKAKAEEKSVIVKKVVVSADKDGGSPVEITITEGGKTRKLLLDKPLTVKTDKDGRIIVFSAAGTDLQAPKDGTISIRVAGRHLKFIDEGKLLQLEEGEDRAISEEGGKFLWIEKSKDGKTEDKVIKEIRIDEGDVIRDLDIKEIEAGKHGVKVIIEKGKEGKPGFAWTMAGETGHHPTWISIGEKDLLEKVRAIREQAAAVKNKKLEFEELEKSLEKLEAELKTAEEKIGKIEMKLAKTGAVWTIDEDMQKNKIIARVEDIDEKGVGEKRTVTCEREDGAVQIVLTGAKGPEGRAAYDRVLEKLKKELAGDGKLVESNYDESSGAMTFKMEMSAAADEEMVKKLVDIATEKIKK